MGASGTATLDFGAFPGSSITSVDVVTAGVISTSLVEAWIRPSSTADHTDADHVAAPMKVVGQYLSDGNIRIFGINTNDVIPPQDAIPSYAKRPLTGRNNQYPRRQDSPMFVGQFNVNWVWL
jgi:hypothetical protein